jgi:hypothetical protein
LDQPGEQWPGEQWQDEEENLLPSGTRTQRPEPSQNGQSGPALPATPTGRNRRQIGGYSRLFGRLGQVEVDQCERLGVAEHHVLRCDIDSSGISVCEPSSGQVAAVVMLSLGHPAAGSRP